MPRLTLSTMRQGRLPEAIGRCQADIPQIAQVINSSEQRLLFAKEAGDEGWYATYALVSFNVLPASPYVPLARNFARIERMNVCKNPVPVQNPFYEYLQFGNGNFPKFFCDGTRAGCQPLQGYDRGGFPTFKDLVGKNRIVRVRATDPLDTQGNKRVLIQGTDSFDAPIYNLDGVNNVQGVFLTLASPFVDTPLTLNSITGIQKDITLGQVQFSDVDPATGNETLILTMDPGEQIGWYRRYFINGLPTNCCPIVLDALGQRTVQVEAIVKLNALPVRIDPDYLLLQNEEAIIAEAQSMRYSTMDGAESKAMAKDAHKYAIGLLQGELAHYLGTDLPAISFKPFGSARLENQRIGTLI
jgi:hypothetical protein